MYAAMLTMPATGYRSVRRNLVVCPRPLVTIVFIVGLLVMAGLVSHRQHTVLASRGRAVVNQILSNYRAGGKKAGKCRIT